MKQCEFCKKVLEDKEVCTCEQGIAAAKEAYYKKKKIFIIAGAITAVIIFVILLNLILKSTRIDPFDYLKIDFEGYDSIGVLDIKFKEKELIEEIIGEKPKDSKGSRYWIEEYSKYKNSIKREVSKETGLSNDDEITIRFTISDYAESKVKEAEKTFVVSGLKSVDKIDVFENIKITFEGISGWGKADWEIVGNNDFIKDCNISISDNYKLSNGESVILSVAPSEEPEKTEKLQALAEEYGKIPLETEKEFKVSGLDSYINETSEISKESLTLVTQKFLEEEKLENLENNEDMEWLGVSYSVPTIYAAYFLKIKDEPARRYNINCDYNEIRIYIKYDRYDNGTKSSTYYSPLIFRDVTKKDGETIVTLSYEDGESPIFTTNIKNHMEELDANFVITEIKY